VNNSTVDAYRQAKALRPYQTTAVDAVVSELERGKRPLLVCPTGGGKSRMSLEVVERCRAIRPGQGLVVTHTNTLRAQSRVTLPGCAVTNIQALTKPGAAGDARRAALKAFSVVFIDEAHHLVSKLWLTVLPLLQHAWVFGGTATPERADGTPLGDAFDALVAAASYTELVGDGFLVPCDIAKPKLNRKEQKRKKVLVDGVQSYIDNAKRDDGSFRPGIYFGPTISDCESASERFNNAGIKSAVVSCDVTGEDRQRVFDAYSRGELTMLCSPVALAEGFDSPRAEVCVLCRSASSLATYIQMVGRILRPCAGKERALLIDCTDAASIHGSPTKDRRYSLTGKGIADIVDIDVEATEREQQEREAWQKVRIEYDIIRDRLKSRFTDLQQEATDSGYKPGWVFHRFSEETQLAAPRILESKYQSVCKHCRKRVKQGEPILWEPGSKVYHRDCWFETLSDEQLTIVKERTA
jgi:superfamily II DNA or RNA helicase